MSEEAPTGGCGGGGGAGGPQRVELSPEEKAVLLECRRQSMIRGFVAGTGFCGVVYWFKAQGRVPSFVNKYPSLFFGLGFLAAFISGANSYRKTCFQKLMSLENSFIADKIREAKREIKKSKHGQQGQNFPVQSKRPKVPTPDVKLEEGPTINVRTYNKDKSMLESRTEDQEQPSAFSGNKDPAPNTDSPQDTTAKKRRTYDEIREENRKKHGQWSHPSPSSQQPQGKPDDREKRKKRNKYGDVIED